MTNSMRVILLVDDDRTERERLAVALRKDIACVVVEAGDPDEALALLDREEVGLVITTLFEPGLGGFELLTRVHQADPGIVTIAAIPANRRELVIKALQLGTFFHIQSPFDLREAVIAAARGLRHHDLLIHREFRGQKMRKSEGFHGLIGQSANMQELFELIGKVAEDSLSTVLIHGESGTGKELVARAIHAHSPRREKNFVPVNCAAIPDDLLESELFGYVKGAFTGAVNSKMGRIQYSDGGTLFLDEIGDMKPALQAKLLRVIQEKEFEPVGGLKPIPVDTRIIAATHCDLEKLVAEGKFREDLYYRLSVVPLSIPPLRERKEDIPILIEAFVHICNRHRRNSLNGFRSEALNALIDYPWPGNVRELENLVQRMAVFHSGSTVTLADLPAKYKAHISEESPPEALSPDTSFLWREGAVDFNNLVSDFENRLIIRALTLAGGNKKEAARILNLKRTTLLEKIKKKGLETA